VYHAALARRQAGVTSGAPAHRAGSRHEALQVVALHVVTVGALAPRRHPA
jgi:hypothetical protein